MHESSVIIRADSTHPPLYGWSEIVFRVPPELACRYADLAGDFTAWVPFSMDPAPGGGFRLSLRLERGRRWRYRFLLDGVRWTNDPFASEFLTDANGGVVSVLHT